MSKSTKKASQDALEALHGAMAKCLADKIRSGEATAADLAVARQFLKDNGIDAIPTADNPLGALTASLPFPTADDARNEEEMGGFH
jgi:hypothetical protein